MGIQLLSFILFTLFVGVFAIWKLRKDEMNSAEDYFLGGRSLNGYVIAGSLLLTNISTEHLIGMNGSAYRNGAIIIAWEVTSALALVLGALYLMPRYLKMGLTTIPEFLEKRFDGMTRTLVALLVISSLVLTLLPIVLYTGALNIQSVFNVSEHFRISESSAVLWIIFLVGGLGSFYAIFGGLKMVAYTDTINGLALLIVGMLIPILALLDIGEGSLLVGWDSLIKHAPEKFKVISTENSIGEGARSSILPFSVLFTGLIINQIYFWTMHQSIIQRALGAINLKEAQKGLLLTGGLKILMPFIIVLPGIIGFYYFGERYYEQPDAVYPALVKEVLPLWLSGLFAAVIVGAVLSTFNSALNSAATLFSLDFYKRYIRKSASDHRLFQVGRNVSILLAILSILLAPSIGSAPDGLYQLLQQLNGIFFIPIASVVIAGFIFPKVSAFGAKLGLLFGLCFYVLMYFVLEVNLHFVHIWGIEFVLNILVMHLISSFAPRMNSFKIQDIGVVKTEAWVYAKGVSAFLVILTFFVYLYFAKFV